MLNPVSEVVISVILLQPESRGSSGRRGGFSDARRHGDSVTGIFSRKVAHLTYGTLRVPGFRGVRPLNWRRRITCTRSEASTRYGNQYDVCCNYSNQGRVLDRITVMSSGAGNKPGAGNRPAALATSARRSAWTRRPERGESHSKYL